MINSVAAPPAHAAEATTETQTPEKPDVFSKLRRQRITSDPDALVEVEKYLADPSSDLSSLNAYPQKLYVKFNSGLPSSASVERLFSLGGRVLTPLRSRLSSFHFEMVMFLKASSF